MSAASPRIFAGGDNTCSGSPENRKFEVFADQPSLASSLYLYIRPLVPILVDFSSSQAVLSSLGSAPSSGYSISVERVEDYGDYIKAKAVIVHPGSHCVVAQAITSPYQFVAIESLKELVFEERVELRDGV